MPPFASRPPTLQDVSRVVGRHLGSLAGEDLAQRCREHKLSAKQRAQSRRERKRAITAANSSRRAGAITRTSEDSWQLAWATKTLSPSDGHSPPVSTGSAEAHGPRRRAPRL